MVLPSLQHNSPEAPSPEPQGRVVMTKVFVTGLKVEAQIGVYAHEKGKAQPLVVDVELDVPTAGATRLADTVNYETIGEFARAIAEKRPYPVPIDQVLHGMAVFDALVKSAKSGKVEPVE